METILDTDWIIWVARTRTERRRGLSGRAELAPSQGMLFPRCRSVHTFGMRFAIDVVLLDAAGLPVDVVRMPPKRLLLPRRRVRHVLEVAAGRGVAAVQEIRWPMPGALRAGIPRPHGGSSA